ncbi:MAG: hypothetical protein J6B64_01315 [Bacilli bacterium]|nr:hypothetical protein [Bacilli bacterium]MBP3635137.1 hypothetical protein [Bacilli bacterium]
MNYLIPANSKKGMLIFGMFNKFDFILLSSGIVTTMILLLAVSPSTLVTALICLAPLFICGFLVIPIPNYHNVLTLIREIIDFFYGRRNYKWKGWCYKDEFK